MTHYDEHTLELFVLGAEEVERITGDIEAHLAECHGCRALVDEMRQYHHELFERLEKQPDIELSTQKALARKRWDPVPFDEPLGAPIPYRPATTVGKAWYFVRKHPIPVSVGSFAIGAGLMALIFLNVNKELKDTNPANVHYNTAADLLEILNRNDEKLWQVPAAGVEADLSAQVPRLVIKDLYGDGRNEVLTAFRFPEDDKSSPPDVPLRILDGKKNVLFMKKLAEPFDYLHRLYRPDFSFQSIVVDDFTHSGKQEIYASADNIGRSPCIIVRLDSKGAEIGEYWHFGNFSGMATIDLGNEGKKLVAYGINDVNDSSYEQFPAIAVFDAAKIVGKTKSSAATGFDVPISPAEEYYIRLPLCDMNHALKVNSNVALFETGSDREILFSTQSGTPDRFPAFSYIFSPDLRVVEVKSTNETLRLHALLVQDGKLTGAIDKGYLDNLKDNVRYWDGKEWRKEVTKVRHDSLP